MRKKSVLAADGQITPEKATSALKINKKEIDQKIKGKLKLAKQQVNNAILNKVDQAPLPPTKPSIDDNYDDDFFDETKEDGSKYKDNELKKKIGQAGNDRGKRNLQVGLSS